MVANLHRIDKNGPAGSVDVVFIHGLGGDPSRTWTHTADESAYWPKWLSEDLPQARVWCAQYPSEPSRWLGDSLPLADSAASLLDRMTQRDFGTRPIVLIGHSLGGLVAKEVARAAQDAEGEAWKNIGKQIVGVCFLATPHRGAFLADFLAVLGNLLRFVRPGRVMQDLSQHDVYIEKLQLWFKKWAVESRLSVHVYREGKETAGVWVVPRQSANPEIIGVDVVGIARDHWTICTPENKTDQVHEGVVAFVKRAIGKRQPILGIGVHPQEIPLSLSSVGGASRSRIGWTLWGEPEYREDLENGRVEKHNWLVVIARRALSAEGNDALAKDLALAKECIPRPVGSPHEREFLPVFVGLDWVSGTGLVTIKNNSQGKIPIRLEDTGELFVEDVRWQMLLDKRLGEFRERLKDASSRLTIRVGPKDTNRIRFDLEVDEARELEIVIELRVVSKIDKMSEEDWTAFSADQVAALKQQDQLHLLLVSDALCEYISGTMEKVPLHCVAGGEKANLTVAARLSIQGALRNMTSPNGYMYCLGESIPGFLTAWFKIQDTLDAV